MAVIKELVLECGAKVRIHDDELPQTPEELERRQRQMYRICKQILQNAALRAAAEQPAP